MFCFSLLAEVTACLSELSDLQSKHEFVSTKTNTLHQSCEHLLEEQTRLMNVAEAISSKLSYYNELDRINSVSWRYHISFGQDSSVVSRYSLRSHR